MAFTASNGRTQTSIADIIITPLVDVVLVLLIIFMVTAPVLQSPNIPRKVLPQPQAGPPISPELLSKKLPVLLSPK